MNKQTRYIQAKVYYSDELMSWHGIPIPDDATDEDIERIVKERAQAPLYWTWEEK